MVAQALLFAAVALFIFVVIGYGIVALLDPDLDGPTLLLVPTVGFAALNVGFGWLLPVLSAGAIVTLFAAVLGLLSAWTAWRRWATLKAACRPNRPAFGLTAAIATMMYLGLLLPNFAFGTFALTGPISDSTYLYAPVGEYLRTHPMPVRRPLELTNPGSVYLVNYVMLFPNGVGAIDGGLSAISGWPVYAAFSLINALFLALLVPTTYALLTGGLHLSRAVAIVAVAFVASHQLLFWVIGMGFQQHISTSALIVTGLALVIRAIRSGRATVAALAGLVAAAMPGSYLPTAGVLVVGAGGFLAVTLVGGLRSREFARTVRQMLVMAAVGGIAALPSLYWLLLGGGLRNWGGLLGVRLPAGGISELRQVSLELVLGVAPLPAVAALGPSITAGYVGWWPAPLYLLSQGLAVVSVVLLLLGMVTLALKRRFAELAIFVVLLAYVLYLRLIAEYPYGFVKTMSYVVPLVGGLIAMGSLGLAGMIERGRVALAPLDAVEADKDGGALTPSPAPPMWRNGAAWLLRLSVVPILAFQVYSAVETQRMWIHLGPIGPAFYRELGVLDSLVTPGSSVLLNNPGWSTDVDLVQEVARYAAAAYHLSDANVDVPTYPIGGTDTRERPTGERLLAYDYVVQAASRPSTVPDAFRVIWRDDGLDLAVYVQDRSTAAGRSTTTVDSTTLDCGELLEFDRRMTGDGWGGPETSVAGESYQWTAATTTTVNLELACDGELDVEFRIISARGDDILDGLILSVNGQPVTVSRRPGTPSGWTFSGRLPPKGVGPHEGPTTLQFSVPRTAPPAGDPRALGLAFDWLRIVRSAP